MILGEGEPLAVAALTAIHNGDIEGLARSLRDNPGLAGATLSRPRRDGPPYVYPLLGATTDWPGHFPRVAESIARLVAAGADPNVPAQGQHRETPLMGAASSDDVAALDALLDAGADIEADGAVIAGGTALDDAVAFGQWAAARRLVERGARTALWHAAALGLTERLATLIADPRPAPHPWGAGTAKDIAVAFWCACHGAQPAAAELLLSLGAPIDWIAPWDRLTPLDAAQRSSAHDLVDWLRHHGAHAAAEL